MGSFIYPLYIICWFSFYLLYHQGSMCPQFVTGTNKPGYLIKKFPFLASIQYDDIHIGTGCILSEKHILTTKKFFIGFDDTKLKVITGYSKIHEKENLQYHSISKAIVHPKFERLRFSFDVAILILKNPLVFDDTTKPIQKFWDEYDVPDSPNYIVVGWGTEQKLMDAHNFSRILHKKSVCILDPLGHECNDAYPYLFQKDSMICGKVTTRGQGVDGFCLSDWGSPLVHYNKDTNDTTLLGLTSYQDNKFKCLLNKPVIFTSISKVIDFITSATGLFNLNKQFIITDNVTMSNNTNAKPNLNQKDITKFAEKIAGEICNNG